MWDNNSKSSQLTALTSTQTLSLRCSQPGPEPNRNRAGTEPEPNRDPVPVRIILPNRNPVPVRKLNPNRNRKQVPVRELNPNRRQHWVQPCGKTIANLHSWQLWQVPRHSQSVALWFGILIVQSVIPIATKERRQIYPRVLRRVFYFSFVENSGTKTSLSKNCHT